MTQPMDVPTEPATDAYRPAAKDIRVGQHLSFPNGKVAEILHITTYADETVGKQVAFTVRGTGSPWIFETHPNNAVRVATAEQVAHQADAVKRDAFVAGLRDMADLIAEDKRLPVPDRESIMVHVYDDETTLATVADAYNETIDDHVGDRHVVKIPVGKHLTFEVINWLSKTKVTA